MEPTKNNKNATKQKKIEIKTIIDDIRQLIETYGSNHDEKIMNTLKKRLKKMKIYGVMKKMMILKMQKNCIRSLNIFKDKIFGEYQQNKKDSTTFIKTPGWINNKKCTINPQNKDNKCFQYPIVLSLLH